jgi:SAM-dependent methyltransferase
MTEDEEKEYYKDEYRKLFSYGNTVEDHFQKALPEAVQRRERVKHLLSKEKRVLEIGCASGYFLYSIKDLVKEAHGVEPHIEYGNYASDLGFEVFSDYNACPKNYYDVVFMFFVLEHLNDPVKCLIEIEALINTGGVLIVEVPNVDDILISVYNIEAFKQFYWQAPHYWYFSREALLMVLSKAGLSAEIIPLQRYDLSNHMTWMLDSKPGGHGKFNHIFGDQLNSCYADALCKNFLCDTLMANCIKA